MAKSYGFVVIDASRPAEEIFATLRGHIAELMNGKVRLVAARRR